jgi:hypothetical protein
VFGSAEWGGITDTAAPIATVGMGAVMLVKGINPGRPKD